MADLAAALVDSENLFRCFRVKGSPRPADIGRLGRYFPAVEPEISAAFGSWAADAFADWLEHERAPELRQSFGKRHDPGVRATKDTLSARGFTLVDVPMGKDRAELALVAAAKELVDQYEAGDITLGGEDHVPLDHAAGVLARTDHAWSFRVVVPDSLSHRQRAHKFEVGGRYHGIAVAALDIIINDRRTARRQQPRQRSADRKKLTAVLREHAGKSSKPGLVNFIDAITAICALPDSSPHPTASWLDSDSKKLLQAGNLDNVIAQSLVSWAREYRHPNLRNDLSTSRELLFFAAFEVCLGGLPPVHVLGTARTYVAQHSVAMLTPFERAVERSEAVHHLT